jgi:VWFA-related protein
MTFPPSHRLTLLTSAFVLGGTCMAVAAQTAPATADVKLDLVVRDKRGAPVRDLRPEEVEVIEASVKRKPSTVTLVGPAAAGTGEGRPRYLTFVFDGLDAEGQKSARKAALEFLTRAAAPDLSVAVFRIGLELWAVQGFTRDVGLASTGIERAAGPDDQGLQAGSAEARTAAAREMGVPELRPAAQALVEAMRVGDEMQKMRQDQSSLYPLIAVCRGLALLPGRKTVLYFSQGLYVPSRLDDVFSSLISEANRASVAVYAIDARGLRTQGDLGAVKSAMDDLNRAGMREAQDATNQQQRGVGDFRLGERVGEGVRQGDRNSLQELSQSTAAEFLAGPGDLRKAGDRILEDSATYYEVAYPPSSPEYDGLFRHVEVKVARPGVRVSERSGYFALPPAPGGATILAYEIPLMNALVASAPPKDLPIRAGALRFGPAKEGRDVLMLVEVPLADFKFVVDEKAKVYTLRFAVLAQVKGEDGSVVYKVSQVYPFEGPVDKLAALKRGNVVFRRSVPLGPGSYTLEAVVQDRGTSATSVARSAFSVPKASGLRTGSISVIRRVDELPADKPGGADPLRVGNLRVVPNLDAPVSKARTPNLSLFMPVYPAAGGGAVSMSLALARAGTTVAQAPVELPAPEPDGRIPAVATFPLDSFEPGAYDVTITVRQGGSTAVENGSFTIVP